MESTFSAYRSGQLGYAELTLARKTLNDLRAQDIQLRSSHHQFSSALPRVKRNKPMNKIIPENAKNIIPRGHWRRTHTALRHYGFPTTTSGMTVKTLVVLFLVGIPSLASAQDLQWSPLRAGKRVSDLRVPGHVIPQENALEHRIHRVPGHVTDILKREGEVVQAGDPLLPSPAPNVFRSPKNCAWRSREPSRPSRRLQQRKNN